MRSFSGYRIHMLHVSTSYWLVIGGSSLQVICLFMLSFTQQNQFYQVCINIHPANPSSLTRLLDFSMPRLGLRVSYKHELRTLACCGVSALREEARYCHGHSRWRDANRRGGILHLAKQPSQWQSRFSHQHPHRCCNKCRAIVGWLHPYAD